MSFCPRLRRPSADQLLVPNGAPTAIRLQLENAPRGSNYHCLLRLGDRTHRVRATLDGDTVTCAQKRVSPAGGARGEG